MDCVYVQDEDQTVYLCVLEIEKGLNIAFSARILQAAASVWIVEDLETLRPPLKMQRKNICRFWLQRI